MSPQRAEGDRLYEQIRTLEGELHDLVDDLPSGELQFPWPLKDAATCRNLRDAIAALRTAVHLVREAYDRENPRYEAAVEAIEERQTAAVH